MQHVKHTASLSNCIHKYPTLRELKGQSVNIFVLTSYHTDTQRMVMKWAPVHDRVKYFSLLHTNIVFRAYTASCKSVGGADSLRWMLYTHVQLVLKIMLLFQAHFLVLEIPLIWTTTHLTSASVIFYHCSALKYTIHPSLGTAENWIFWNSLW